MEARNRMPRVIVAEDDDDMRTVMCELIASLGVEVATAASGGELVRLLTDDGGPIDLVVTDVRMPWMTGYNVALSARNSGLGVPIIIVTAFPDDVLAAQVEGLGAAVLLAKPFRPEELLSLVRARLPAARADA